MKSREFFLFPDIHHAEDAVEDLKGHGVPENAIHAIAREGMELGSLPVAGNKQLEDVCCKLETRLWNGNLALFGVALVGLLASWWQGYTVGILTAATVMLVTFLAGERFAVKVPSVRISEFQEALKHGEILLAVDLPKDRVPEIDRTLVGRHPEAVRGGVSWIWPALV